MPVGSTATDTEQLDEASSSMATLDILEEKRTLCNTVGLHRAVWYWRKRYKIFFQPPSPFHDEQTLVLSNTDLPVGINLFDYLIFVFLHHSIMLRSLNDCWHASRYSRIVSLILTNHSGSKLLSFRYVFFLFVFHFSLHDDQYSMLTPRGQPQCWIKRIAFHLSTDCISLSFVHYDLSTWSCH